MAEQNESAGELVFGASLNAQTDPGEILNQLDELKALVQQVYDVGNGLARIGCGMEVKIGDSRAARLFATLMGLDEYTAHSEPEEDPGEAMAVSETGSHETNRVPYFEDLLHLPRLKLTALRERGKLEFVDGFDPLAFVKKRLNHMWVDGVDQDTQYIWLQEGAYTELMIRLFLGNSEERLDIHDLLIIFREIFKKNGLDKKLVGLDRRGITRRVRKLLSAGFIIEVVKARGGYGAIYMLNPDYDPAHPYLRRYFFGRINAALHRPVVRKPRKKRGRKKLVVAPTKPPKPRYKY